MIREEPPNRDSQANLCPQQENATWFADVDACGDQIKFDFSQAEETDQ